MRLCGPATLGEKNDRLLIAVLVFLVVALLIDAVFTVFFPEDRVCVPVARE